MKVLTVPKEELRIARRRSTTNGRCSYGIALSSPGEFHPERQEVRLTVDYPKQPFPRTPTVMKQRLVFATRPPNQRVSYLSLDGPERRRIETPVVVEPPSQLGVDLLSEFCDGLRRTQCQLPAADLVADLPLGIIRDGRTETAEVSSSASRRLPGAKRETQEVESLQ